MWPRPPGSGRASVEGSGHRDPEPPSPGWPRAPGPRPAAPRSSRRACVRAGRVAVSRPPLVHRPRPGRRHRPPRHQGACLAECQQAPRRQQARPGRQARTAGRPVGVGPAPRITDRRAQRLTGLAWCFAGIGAFTRKGWALASQIRQTDLDLWTTRRTETRVMPSGRCSPSWVAG